MIKLICKNCGETWYTSNTKPNQICNKCDGLLVEVALTSSVGKYASMDFEDSCNSKIIELDKYFPLVNKIS